MAGNDFYATYRGGKNTFHDNGNEATGITTTVLPINIKYTWIFTHYIEILNFSYEYQ